jgi:hypothetical protein
MCDVLAARELRRLRQDSGGELRLGLEEHLLAHAVRRAAPRLSNGYKDERIVSLPLLVGSWKFP